MNSSLGNVNRFATSKVQLLIVSGYNGLTIEDIPVFCAAAMSLETQALSRVDNDLFDFVLWFIRKDLIVAPGTMVFCVVGAQS